MIYLRKRYAKEIFAAFNKRCSGLFNIRVFKCILTGISFSDKNSNLTCGWVSLDTKPEELLSRLGESGERFDFGDGIYADFFGERQ